MKTLLSASQDTLDTGSDKQDEGTKVSLSLSVNITKTFSTQLSSEIVIPSMEQLAQTGGGYLSKSAALLAASLSQYIERRISAPLSQDLTDTANQYLAKFNSSTESLKSMTESFSQQLITSFGQIRSLVNETTAAAATSTLSTAQLEEASSVSTDSQGKFPSLPMSLVIPSAPNDLIEAALSATVSC